MTADVEFLLLPEPDTHDAAGYRRAYSPEAVRACVAHATAANDAEIEALRAEVEQAKGRAAANLQRAADAESRAERLAEALRRIEGLEPAEFNEPETLGLAAMGIAHGTLHPTAAQEDGRE